jgi:hypothetical protein
LRVSKRSDKPGTSGNPYFGATRHRLHASSNGRHAAIVVDWRRHGMVVDVLSGAVTMNLDGGDYHEETVPFSACFACRPRMWRRPRLLRSWSSNQ